MEEWGWVGLEFLKGYSVLTIKHKGRYEELTEERLAYLSWSRAATCLCHILFFLCVAVPPTL